MNSLNLKDYIFIKNCIDKEQCSQIIENIKNQTWEKHTWYGYSVGFNSYEEKELNALVANDFSKNILTNPIIDTINDYFKITKGDKFVHQFSHIRFNHYPIGTMMRQHIDHIYTLFDGSVRGVPVLSIVGLLNDNYKGGEFVFFDDYEVKLKMGDIMIFPSNFMFKHEVKEILEGDRFSFVSWAF